MSKLEDLVYDMAQPICERHGCFIYDIEFKKEGKDRFLRVFIDKENGVTIDDCEAVSRELSDTLDAEDPISETYCLEVSSPGIERVLKKDWHYEAAIGEDIEIRLFAPMNGTKTMSGTLLAYDRGLITIDTPQGPLQIEKGKVAHAKKLFK